MHIQSHNLIQGTTEWHLFRSKHFGASEASAMLGLSPYKTRDQLLHEKKTGLSKELSQFVQERILDNGHRVEALTRPIAEKLIGEELSPMTFSSGRLSASCDGISFMGDWAWENKQFNAEHYEQVKSGVLPEIHWPQCQQVMYCSGADKLFFTISDGTEERTAGVWVPADEKLQRQLVAGWAQFEKDLEDYVIPVQVEKVEAETVQTLPVPSVVVKGEVTVSNLSEITPKFDAYLGGIKTELITDQDFADAEANGDNCEETEKRIKSLRENIIAQMVDVNTIDSTLANYQEAFRKMKVLLKNAVKEQKDNIKSKAIMKAKTDYADFVAELNKDIPVMLSRELVCPDFATAIKGVQKLDSMRSRIDSALANGKVEATTYANDVRTKIAYISEAIKGYEHLINVPELATKDLDYIKLHIQSRKDAEDKRKSEYEAQVKARVEIEAKAADKLDEQSNVSIETVDIRANAPVANIKFIPSPESIVMALASAYKVGEEVALEWLQVSDFSKVNFNKQAS